MLVALTSDFIDQVLGQVVDKDFEVKRPKDFDN